MALGPSKAGYDRRVNGERAKQVKSPWVEHLGFRVREVFTVGDDGTIRRDRETQKGHWKRENGEIVRVWEDQ